MSNPLLIAALDYAARGWKVFPVWWIENSRCACGEADCQNPGKHPLGKLAHNGRNSATTDPETIRIWWGKCPQANIGIATGIESGLVVVDVDPRHGGNESKKKLERLGIFPYTVMAYTGGGGEHILLKHPGNGQKIKSKEELGGFAGIDQKGDGGYVVAPPSNHISGNQYTWKIPPETPLAKIPEWLLTELTKDSELPRGTVALIGETIPDGKRNGTLTSLAGTMRRRGMSQEAIEAALLAENKRCDPPLLEKVVLTIAKSISRKKPAPQDEKEQKPTQAEILIKLAADAELFHDMNRKGYATIPVEHHLETWPIKSVAFRDWLRGLFYKAHGKPPGGQALQDALDLLAAQARFDGDEHEIYVRVAHMNGKVYVDLANESWQAVEITPQGWRVVDNPPVKFRRPRGLAPMPTPKPGGYLADLKPFINCREKDWPLVVGWLIGGFSSGPYPIMIFQGEQGTAKSTTARALKNVVDPGHSPQRTAPREVRDLMISASNSWCLSFDNLSALRDWLSDGFCRLATGGGLSTRELYSDDNETILDAMRPIILNGIDSLVSRADLADRAILLELPQIKTNHRRHEADLWKSFEAAQPGILGAVFKALSVALANVHAVKLPELPRMADFATWVVAAEPALPWEPGTFLDVYNGNRAAVVEHSLEGDPVAVAVRLFMEHRQEWEGTPTGLLNELTDVVGDLVSRGKTWPKAANGLTNRLRRATTFLRAIGIEIESGYVKRERRLLIRKGMQKTVATVATVASEEYQGVTCNDPCNDATIHEKRSLQLKVNNHAGCNDSNDSNDKKPSFPKTDANGQPLGEVEF